MRKISFIVNGHTGCDYYRARNPYIYLSQTNTEEVQFKLVEIADLERQRPEALETLATSDIWIIGRIADPNVFARVESIKQKHGKDIQVIIDYDDDMNRIMPLNPAYRDWGTSNIFYRGQWLYKDKETVTGHNPDGSPVVFDIERNKGNLTRFKTCVQKADWITVTTEELEKTYRKHTQRVGVLPNLVDTDLWSPLNIVKTDEIRICWAGGSSHYEDLISVLPNLASIIAKFPKTKLVMVGQRFDGIMKSFPADRIEYHAWSQYPVYPHIMRSLNFDIGICPLIESPFNHNKSAVKWMEYSALEIPSVCANMKPYSPVVKDNETALLYDTPKDFAEKLESLIVDKELRVKIGKQAREEVIKNHSWKNNVNVWREYLKSR